MTTSHDVVVVGCGAIGAACARELAVSGHQVLILDRGRDQGDAWRAAAGMLAAQIEADGGSPLFELGLAGRERYPDLVASLEEATGISIGLWQEGIARIATQADEVPDLKSKVAWQRQQGHLCDWFDSAEVRNRWPWLGPSEGAVWAPRDGALDPQRLVDALTADAVRRGARVIHDEARALERRGDRIVGVVGRELYAAGQVVVAGGAWSGRLGELPRPITVEPIRGQMASFPWPRGVERSIVVSGVCYLVARSSEALVGSTMENAGFDTQVTSAGLARIFAAVSALCPSLATLEVTKTWAGLRPVTPDGLPIVGREPRVEGLWYATGHGRNGILLAGITGLIIARLLAGETEIEHLGPLRPERFWEW